MSSREAPVNKCAVIAIEVLSLVSISARSLTARSFAWLYFSEKLIVQWFSNIAPIVLYFTFHDISGRSMVLLGGAILTLSALLRKYSMLSGSTTLRNLAIITQSYSYCEVMGMLLVPSSRFHSHLSYMSILIALAGYFDPFAMLPFDWQETSRCAYQLSFTLLLYFLVPNPPLIQETEIELSLRLSKYAGFAGVQLVVLCWLQYRSSFKSFNIMPSNPWYALIASLVFIGLNFIWLRPLYHVAKRKHQLPLN